MENPTESHARNSRIDLGSKIQKHPAYRVQSTRQIRHQLCMHGLRQCGSKDEGEAGPDLLRIVAWNSQSDAASGMWSNSAQPSTTMSGVRLYSEDPERKRSPDDEHHE